MRTHGIILTFATLFLGIQVLEIQAKPEFWDAFYTEVYTNAHGTQLNTLPSASSSDRPGRHCGVCHWDFGGGGQRNPYGSDFHEEVKHNDPDVALGLVENMDSDGD
ncbi:MAG: hypothetical protein U9P12_03385, partial [Verrucomicrobiota bacterium]|nr:hypothetical protein [Verrucomicrobiota bacterium]